MILCFYETVSESPQEYKSFGTTGSLVWWPFSFLKNGNLKMKIKPGKVIILQEIFNSLSMPNFAKTLTSGV